MGLIASAFGTGAVSVYVYVPQAAPTSLGGAAQQAQAAAAGIPTLKGSPVFLGTGEKAPRIRYRRAYSPVHNDLTGPLVPYDRMAAGKEAFVSIVLTRWVEAVRQVIQSTPFPGRFPGSDLSDTDGTLVVTEGAAYGLILRYAHFDTNPVMKAAGLLPGKRFYAAILDGEEEEELGTDANKCHLMFYCQRVYVPVTGQKILYDYNMAGTPPIPPA